MKYLLGLSHTKPLSCNSENSAKTLLTGHLGIKRHTQANITRSSTTPRQFHTELMGFHCFEYMPTGPNVWFSEIMSWRHAGMSVILIRT